MDILREITPLSESDCFYIAERYKYVFNYPLHSHSEYELNFIEKGSGLTRIVGDSVSEITDYDLVLITGQDLAHEWRTDKSFNTPIREITIQFSPSLFVELLHKTQFSSINTMLEGARLGLSFPLSSTMKVYPKLNKLSSQSGFNAVIEFLYILYELSLDLDKATVLSSVSYTQTNDNYNSRRIKKLCEFINSNYQKEIRLEQLAEMVGMTTVGVSRFFKQRSGKSISDYIIEVRLGHVARLLTNSTHSVSEICFECGFNNISNFNRIFLKKRGCSPSDFRRNYVKKRIIF